MQVGNTNEREEQALRRKGNVCFLDKDVQLAHGDVGGTDDDVPHEDGVRLTSG